MTANHRARCPTNCLNRDPDISECIGGGCLICDLWKPRRNNHRRRRP